MGRLRRFDLVAGVGGVVLFASLFLQWYGLDVPEPTGENLASQPEYTFYAFGIETGWQTFTVIDLVLAAIALLAIAVPLVAAAGKGLATALTLLAVLLVAFRLIVPPFSLELEGFELSASLEIGAWIGLAGALIAFVGSFGALRDRSPATAA